VALAAVLWIALGVIVWNVVFDDSVRRGSIEYLQRQTRHDQGLGPAVTIDSVMRPAIAAGAWRATAWGAGVAIAGLALITLATQKRRRPPD
jgi:hypothetical protein